MKMNNIGLSKFLRYHREACKRGGEPYVFSDAVADWNDQPADKQDWITAHPFLFWGFSLEV